MGCRASDKGDNQDNKRTRKCIQVWAADIVAIVALSSDQNWVPQRVRAFTGSARRHVALL
jgi:hypothetical protein